MRMRTDDRGRQFVLYAFVAIVVLLSVVRWHGPSQAGGLIQAASRKPMPDLQLGEVGGGQWILADHRGQVVLINYWATWCEPCREELPGLMQVARKSGPNGLAVVGVSMDDGRDAEARVRDFVARYRIPYTVAFPTWNAKASVIGLPTTVLLDRKGRVAKTYVGAVESKDFEKDVTALLAES
jgi:cytochrome c biogenesis protein CcmG, thiol:disulfide interchange protein DsbE